MMVDLEGGNSELSASMSMSGVFRIFLIAAALVAISIEGLTAASENQVQVELVGSIASHCSSNVNTLPVTASDLTQPGSSAFSFTIDCNAPFQYTMQSENGAMMLNNAPASVAASKLSVPYNVHMQIPLSLGGAIDDMCNSASLLQGAITCKFTDSGQKVAIAQQAKAQLSWQGSRSTQLLKGFYSDRLTIYVTIKP